MPAISVLLFLGDQDSATFTREQLRHTSVDFTIAVTHRRVLEEISTKRYSTFVYRKSMLSKGMLELIATIKHLSPFLGIIVNVKTIEVDDVIRLMRLGVKDIVITPVLNDQAIESIARAATADVGIASTDGENQIVSPDEREQMLIGQSPAISELRSAIALVAKSDTSVLITGESGTGKEVVARHIHKQSDRAGKPFIGINCAVLPGHVLENELFGYEKGAFAGASNRKLGGFELADHGMLFFDEIAEMTPDLQAKLLRAVDMKAFRRLGGKKDVHVDVRLIAATNKNIALALKARELREDLYYRLSTIEIAIPPLREHKEDIPFLLDHFLSIFREKYEKPVERFSEESCELLADYDWPGNVRELRNIVERSIIVAHEGVITPNDLPQRITVGQSLGRKITIPIGSSAEEAERLLILQTLAAVQNNKSKAARILGLSRKTLHNKLGNFTQQKRGFSDSDTFLGRSA